MIYYSINCGAVKCSSLFIGENGRFFKYGFCVGFLSVNNTVVEKKSACYN